MDEQQAVATLRFVLMKAEVDGHNLDALVAAWRSLPHPERVKFGKAYPEIANLLIGVEVTR